MRREQLQKEYTETREQGKDGTEITTASWPDGSAVRTMVPPQGAPVITVTAPRGHFGRHESEHGPYISTPGARKLDQTDLLEALGHFRAGDWGDACEENREMNDLSRSRWRGGRHGSLLKRGQRVLDPRAGGRGTHSTAPGGALRDNGNTNTAAILRSGRTDAARPPRRRRRQRP